MYQITIDGTTYTGAKPRAIAHGGTVYPANCRNPAWVEVPEPEPVPPTLADIDPAEAARQAALLDAQAQYAAYCAMLKYPTPVDLDDLAPAIQRYATVDHDGAIELALTLNGLVAKMCRLARDPAALDQILPNDAETAP